MMRDKRDVREDLNRYLDALSDHILKSAQIKFKKGQNQPDESEQIFRVIFDNAADGILLADAKSRKFYMGNKVICQMLDLNENELKELEVIDIHPDEHLSYVMEQFEKQIKGESTLAKDMPVKRKDGTVFYADINAFPITFGDKTYLMGIFRDVTERKEAEDAVRESEERFRTLLLTAPSVVLYLSSDYRILEFNAEAERVYGCKRVDVLGKNYLEMFIPENARAGVAMDIKKVLAGKKTRGYENPIKCADGCEHIFVWNVNRVLDKHGCPIGIITFGQDITEHRKAEEQVRKLSSAVEQSIDGVGIGNLESKILYVNEAYARMHGYTPEEMVGINAEVLQSDTYVEKYKKVRYLIKTRGAWSGEMMHVRKDGTDFPVYMSVTLLKDESGQATGIIGVCRDITEYKKTQKNLIIKDAAIASSINAIAIGDEEGYLTYVNDSFLEMWGFKDRNEVIGRNAAEFWMEPEQASAMVEKLQKRRGWIGEMTAVRKDGSMFDVQVCATSVIDDNDRLISIMGSFIDITESKRSLEQLNAYREKIARTEQLASLGTLSATLAHELTQPLTIIRLSLESAMEKLRLVSSPETFANKLKDSLNQVSNMASITERFRNFARRSSERIVGEVDLKTVAERIVVFLSESAKRANVELRFEGWEELPHIYWNENDLEQLFFTLITNAVQAADGKKNRRLIIRGFLKNNQIELQFSDNCGGISPNDLDRIFEPFFTTKSQGHGTGLGLCIAQDIVSRAGGRINVENKFGDGSTFSVILPLSEDRMSQINNGK
jgi:PAS domain S-box-containing protein